MNIKITTALDVRDGYGYVGQNLILALDNLGHQVYVNPVKIWYSEDQLNPRVKELIRGIKQPDFELVIMYPVYDFKELARNSAIITMYEAHKCPAAWVKRLNSLKLPILAPSDFVAQMFKNSGVKCKVWELPLGIDTSFYASKLREYPVDRPFRFLSIGKMEPRKNAGLTVDCFERAFSNNDNVELVLKTRERFLPPEVRSAAKRDGRIKIIEKTITEEELRKLYYYCDAFIYPSRGEGFSFPPRNAVATGMPTLVTDWSALAEIDGALKIDCGEMSPMPPCGFSYGEHNELLMANPSKTDLIQKMQQLYYNQNYYNKAASLAYSSFQASWEDSAKILINLVEAMC